MFVILIVAGAYAGVRYLEQKRIKDLDAAFFAFNEAELERRPDRLIQVASEQSGEGAIPELSLLSAADLHMQAYHLRIMPGTLGVDAADQLDDAQAQEMLDKAAELYARVFNEAKAEPGRELLAIGGRWGMAAVELSKKNFDAAEQALSEIIEIAQPLGFNDLAGDARALIQSFPELKEQRDPIYVEPAPTPQPEVPAEDQGESETPAEADTPTATDDPTGG